MTLEEITGTRMTLDVAWDGETGVRVRVLDTDPVAVKTQTPTTHELLSRPLTVEQAAVAMTSLADVYLPNGDGAVVLAVRYRSEMNAFWATVEMDSEQFDTPLRRLAPSSGLLRVIEQRYGRGVTLADD